MHISKINYSINFSAHNKSTFRDDELFDERLDSVTGDYKTYDQDSIQTHAYATPLVDYDFTQLYGTNIEPRQRLNITPLVANIDSPAYTNTDFSLPDNELFEASFIMRNDEEVFCGSLYNYMRNKQKENFTSETIADICDAAKLTKNNGNEYFDSELADAGLCLTKTFKSANNTKAKALMQELVVLDHKGNEVFLKDAFEFLRTASYHSKNKSIDKYISAINDRLLYDKDGVVVGFATVINPAK